MNLLAIMSLLAVTENNTYIKDNITLVEEKATEGVEFFGEHLEDGLEYLDEHAKEGSEFFGEHLEDGLEYLDEHAKEGSEFFDEKMNEGFDHINDKTKSDLGSKLSKIYSSFKDKLKKIFS